MTGEETESGRDRKSLARVQSTLGMGLQSENYKPWSQKLILYIRGFQIIGDVHLGLGNSVKTEVLPSG